MQPRIAWKVTTQPASEPLALSDVKAELGVTGTSDDARLTRLIKAARQAAEEYTGRAFITQTITVLLDTFPSTLHRGPWWNGTRQVARAEIEHVTAKPITLPRPPLQSVTSITITQDDGTTSALNVADLIVDATSEPARLMHPTAWPTTRARAGVTIVLTAGYGSNANDVPAAITNAIMLAVRDAYERPNPSVTSERIDNAATTYADPTTTSGAGGAAGTTGLPPAAIAALAPYRVRDAGHLASPLAL